MTTATFHIDSQTDDELITTISAARDEFTRQQARFLVALSQFEERKLATACGASSTVTWIVRRFDVADSTAYDYLRVARILGHYGQVAHSFLNGRINYSKVRLLARYLTDENELDLVMLAESKSYRELERELAGRHQPDEEDEPKQENSFDLWVDKATGEICFKGRLDPVAGQQLLAALKVGELANLVDLSELDPDTFRDEEKLDEALAEAEESPEAVEAEIVEPEEKRTASRFGRTARGKLISAFQGLLNLAQTSPANTRRAPGAQVHVMVTEDGHAFLPGNPAADAKSLTGAIFNSEVRGHLLDNKGNPLKLGRKRRLVSNAQATAILARWMFQCAMPGCNHSQFIEFHHIVAWLHGGLTDPENLLPLCSHCHSLVTKGLVTIEPDLRKPQLLHFRFRDGTEFVSENRNLPKRSAVGKPDVNAPLPEEPVMRAEGDLSFADRDGEDYARA